LLYNIFSVLAWLWNASQVKPPTHGARPAPPLPQKHVNFAVKDKFQCSARNSLANRKMSANHDGDDDYKPQTLKPLT